MIDKENKILAIDISNNTIEIVESNFVDGETKILAMNRAQLKAGIIENGEIKNIEELKKEISILISEAKPKTMTADTAVFVLPDNLIYSHLFELKEGDMTNLDLETEANKVIPISQKNRLLTSKEFNLNNKKYCLVLATNKQVVKTWQDFFASININLSKIEFGPVTAYYGIEHPQSDKITCLLDIGASTSSVSFFNESGLIYFFNLFQAGSAITKKIALERKITIAKAETLKLNTSIHSQENKVAEIIKSDFKNIFSELEKNINYLKNIFQISIEQVIVLGGQAKQKGLEDYLKNLKFVVPSALAKPLLLKNEKLEYINTIGLSRLAYKQADNIEKRIKFFTENKKEYEISQELIEKIDSIKSYFKKNKRIVILLAIFIFVIITGIITLNFKKNIVKNYNQIDIEYPHYIKLPLVLEFDTTVKNKLGSRVVKVKIEKAGELEKVLSEGRHLAEAELKSNEVLWKDSISVLDKNNLVFPLYLEWLIYDKNKIQAAVLEETRELMFGIKYIFESMELTSLEVDDNYKIYALVNIHSVLTLEEIRAQAYRQEQKDEKKQAMIKVKNLGGNLNVRQGPGIIHPVVGQALPLGLYEFVKEENDWYQINLSKDISGWVLGRLVEKQ